MPALSRPNLRGMLIAALLLAGWTASLFFSGYRDIIYAPASWCLLLAAALALIPACWRGINLPSAPAAIWFGAFWLYATISLTWTTVPFSSLVTWLVFMSLPITFAAFTVPHDGLVLLRPAGAALLTGFGILGAWAVIQIVFFSSDFGARAHNPMVNPNNLAALLDLGLLPVLAIVLMKPDKRVLRVSALILYAVLFAGILATQSRGGVLCLAVAAAVLYRTLRDPNGGDRKNLIRLLIGAAIIFLAMQFAGPHAIGGRLLLKPANGGSLLARLAIWRSTLTLIAQHPFAGTGLGTFYLYFPAVRAPLIDDSSGSWAHNDPLQFWAEMGILAPLLFCAFIIAAVRRTLLALRRTARGTWERAALMGLSCGLLALTLHAQIEFEFYLMPTMIAAGVALAGWYHVTAHILTGGEDEFIQVDFNRWQRPFMAGAMMVVVALLALAGLSSAAGQYYLRRGQDAMDHGDVTGFLVGIQRAELRAPGSFIDPEVQLAGFYIDILAKPLPVFPPAQQAKMFNDAKDLLDEAARMNPAWSEIDRKRAKLYNEAPPGLLPDNKAKALDALRLAVRKNPMNFQARQELAETVMRQGRAEEAYTLLSTGLEYPHDAVVDADYNVLLRQVLPFANVQKLYQQRQERNP